MQKVADIKFLKVYWDHGHNSVPDMKDHMDKVMDKAYAELEASISEYLKKGWVMKGELIEKTRGHVHRFNGYILQTMVKYETTKEAELLTF